MTDIIFPLGNKREYEDVPDDLKQGMTPHFVDSYEQVFDLAFPDAPAAQQQQQPGSSKQEQELAAGGAGAAGGAAAAAAASFSWW